MYPFSYLALSREHHIIITAFIVHGHFFSWIALAYHPQHWLSTGQLESISNCKNSLKVPGGGPSVAALFGPARPPVAGDHLLHYRLRRQSITFPLIYRTNFGGSGWAVLEVVNGQL